MAATTEMIPYEGLVENLDERTYHAHPSLSSTQARQLLESPSHYRWGLEHPRKDTQAFDVGTAAHSKVLGVGAGVIAYPDDYLTPSGNVSTSKAAVAWAAEQRAEGLTPVSPDQIDAVDGMAESVLAHPAGRALVERAGISEASVFATDPETGIEVRCRFDRLTYAEGSGPFTAGDLKTAAAGGASEAEFRKSIAKWGYDVQQGFYESTAEFAFGYRPDFKFYVVEKVAPYRVAVHQLTDPWAHMGREKARIARERLAEARETGDWWGYPDTVTYLDAPTWLNYEYEARYGDNEPFEDIQ